MKEKAFLVLSGLLLTFILPVLLFAATYYISPTGSDINPGTLSQPWKTIAKANQTLSPGDTVFIMAGTYHETIRPSRSGNPNLYIVFARYREDQVTISNVTHGVDLSEREYIVIDGLKIVDVSHWVWMRPNSHHNIIQNCEMENSTGWGGIDIRGGTYNKILNNILKKNNDDGICIYRDSDSKKGSYYNLIQGNEISDCVHNLIMFWGRNKKSSTTFCKYNIVKGNILYNPNEHTNLNLVHYSDYNLIEDNIIYESAPDGPGVQLASSHNILRRNLVYKNYDNEDVHAGFYLYSGFYEISNECIGNKIYHNVIYQNDRAGFSIREFGEEGTLANNKFKNNIIYKNIDPTHQIWYDVTSYHDDLWEGNNILSDKPGQNIVSFNSPHKNLHTLDWLESNYPDGWKNNVEADPLFVDEAIFDFHLQSGSPCIDAGTFLTVTTSSGSGTIINVEDAGYFCDGFGVIDGDRIQLQDQTQITKITNVDYAKNTITIDRMLSWYKGQGISLPYSGSAPDIGAFEYQNSDQLDTTPPTGSVIINNDESITYSTSVTLTLSATDDRSGMGSGAEMKFSNDNVIWTDPEPYAATKSWTLAGGDGEKTVYVKFKDSAGNWMVNPVSDEIILAASTPAYLIHNTFEVHDEGWGGAIGNTGYERDNSDSYSGNYSMHVYATEDKSKLSIGVNPDAWNIDQHPFLSFTYKIPPNVPVAIFFNTEAGWGCLGGSRNYDAGGYPVNDVFTLMDDNSWHQITIDVKDKIREIYPSVNSIVEFEWYTQNNGKQGDEFWFDEVKILANDSSPIALIHHTFEQQDEGWGGAIGKTGYVRSSSHAYEGHYSMYVYSTGQGSKLSIGMNPAGWSLDQYPFLSVAYKIPRHVPVGLFFNTEAGWICLGGSKNHDAGSYPENNAYTLLDDDLWHQFTIDARDRIREVYPAANTVLEFEWYTQNNAQQEAGFWFDEVMILMDRAAPVASIDVSDPSPTKAGKIEVTLTTSKDVVNLPAPLVFTESDSSEISIDLQGTVPGKIFTGTFIVDESVADGMGYFSLPAGVLVDEQGHTGNEIISGSSMKIDKIPPSKPKNFTGQYVYP